MQLDSTELKHFTQTQEINPERQYNKKYVKITQQVKKCFLKLIIEQNMSIKKASQALRINYSSAKAILSVHKKSIRLNRINLHELDQKESRSSYRLVNNENTPQRSKLSINCSVGGKLSQNNVNKALTLFKPSILVPLPNWINNTNQQTDISIKYQYNCQQFKQQ